MASPNLNIPDMTASQLQKDATANSAFADLDQATQDNVVKDVSSTGSLTVTAAEFEDNFLLVLDDTADDISAGFTLTVPDGKRFFMVENATDFVATVDTTTTGTQVTVLPGQKKAIVSKGTDLMVVGVGDAVEFRAFVNGTPGASQIILQHVVTKPFTLAIGLPNSQGYAKVVATSAAAFDVNKNGSSQGTFDWDTVNEEATFTFASSVSFAIGDRLDIVAPATPDASLADIAFTIVGTRD